MEILRGDIFYIAKHGYTQPQGSEQEAGRPAVIVSNNEANKYSRSVSVVYLTTQEKKPLPTHCEVVARTKSTALCEGVTTISKDRLLDYVKSCTEEEMAKIDECLMVALGIDTQNEVDVYEENANEMKFELEAAYKEAERLKHECEEAQELCKDFESENKLLLSKITDKETEIADLLKKLKSARQESNLVNFDATRDLLKAETERDLYKQQYEMMLGKLLER